MFMTLNPVKQILPEFAGCHHLAQVAMCSQHDAGRAAEWGGLETQPAEFPAAAARAAA